MARALAPKHVGAPFELASVLERGTTGRLLGRGADFRAAAEAWRAAYDLDATKTNAQGQIQVPYVSPGVYEITCPDLHVAFQLDLLFEPEKG